MGPERPPSPFATYHAATRGGAPRKTVLTALDRFAAERAPGDALDLGCGTGRDTTELLRRGWRVCAVDADGDALAELAARHKEDCAAGRLVIRQARFEAIDLTACDLVNSSFALPLCGAPAFPALWARIRAALRPGGRMACHLFGPHDDWAKPGRADGPAIHTRAELDALLSGLTVELLEEEETDAVTPRGRAKHWHIFHIVARQP